MVKTIISAACAAVILFAGAAFEMNFVKRQFAEFDDVVSTVYEKVENQTAIEDDVYALQKDWLGKKKYLHIFIPHNEIKEMDLWIAESVTLVRNEKWEDALSKIEVLKELSEQIPKTFVLTIENVF